MKVVKIGGNVVDNPAMLESFCRDFALLEGPKVLVHGGGVMAGRIQEALGNPQVKIQGRRVTDAETLKVVTMVYAGLCNKTIVALLQKEGCNALGLSGCDASVIKADKRAPLMIDGREVDFGFVGDVSSASVDAARLRQFCDSGLVPVLSAINHDGAGNLLNTNADTVASSVAAALGAELITCFEKKGVLLDVDDEDSVLPSLTPASYEALKAEGRIADGMIPKLQNAFKALHDGAARITIKHAADLLDAGSGTSITLG